MIRIFVHVLVMLTAGMGIGASLALMGILGIIPVTLLVLLYMAWIYVEDYDAIADNIEYQPRHGKRAGVHRKVSA